MATLSIRIPESLHNGVKEFSKKDQISINQFIASAITEKIAAFETQDYLISRARQGEEVDINELLDKAPDIKPISYEE